MALETLYERLAENPSQRARFVTLDGTLVEKTFGEMHADVVELMAELRAAGLGAGDLVGVLGPNTYEWILADLALLGLRCVVVAPPVERHLTPARVAELMERYRLTAALVTRALPSGAEVPRGVAVLEERPVRLQPRTPGERPSLDPGVVTVVFSSGTAGTTKGLPLTDAGIMNTIDVSAEAWEVTRADDILIVMPFSSFQQRYLFYLAVWAGCAASTVVPERMFLLLKTLEPTILLGPPSFFEIVHNRVMSAEGAARRPYALAATLSRVPFTRGLRARLGRPWLSMYGGRVRLMLTGSAPVPPRMVTVFQQLGAPLYEIYGSTESGWIACNTRRHHRVGAAGRPVRGVTVELGDDGEVLLRVEHPQAHGYVYEGVESQAAVFRPDGRIATGDLGTFDRAGFLHLTGRKKNVIITRSGVKINPEPIEAGLEQACPGAKAVVVSPAGDGVLTCVVWVPDGFDQETVARYVAETGRGPGTHRIAATVLRPAAELTVESGLLTRNLKIDRNAVVRTVFAPTGGGRG